PYIHHVIVVTRGVAKHEQQAWVIASALLHDVFEDSPFFGHLVTKDDIVKFFGKLGEDAIIPTVEALTEVQKSERVDSFVGTVQKVIERGLHNPAVILIKVCDRLHNMRTISAMSSEKQQRKAQETYMIYAQLAKRFGLFQEAEELAERSIKILNVHRGGRGLNKRIHRSLQELTSRVNLDELRKNCEQTLGIYSGVTIQSIHYPSFADVYDEVAQREQQSTSLPSEWRVMSNDLAIMMHVCIPNDEFDPNKAPEAQVLWVQQRLWLFLPLGLNSDIFNLPQNKLMGMYDVLEKARRGVYGEKTTFSLRLKTGFPFHVVVSTYDDYAREKVSIAIFTSRWHDPVSVALADEKRREIQREYHQWMDEEATREAIEIFGNVLHGSIPVFIVDEPGREVQKPVYYPVGSTIADLMVFTDNWQNVEAVEVDGRIINLLQDFSLQLTDGAKIRFIRTENHQYIPHIAFVDSLKIHQAKRQSILQQIERMYQNLQNSSEKELYRQGILTYAWQRFIDPIKDQIIPFNLRDILPRRYQTSDDFLFDYAFGKIPAIEVEELQKKMLAYVKSLTRVIVSVHDVHGIKHRVLGVFYSPNGSRHNVPNLIHDEIVRERGGNEPQLVFYFHPDDPAIGNLSTIQQDIQNIDGVVSVEIHRGSS
ncbi:MAG: HD domain-containing protein, partial [Patescibacteria group bacterium]|nr:HD domain-containing protein [Patescibacteria group bacterium]